MRINTHGNARNNPFRITIEAPWNRTSRGVNEGGAQKNNYKLYDYRASRAGNKKKEESRAKKVPVLKYLICTSRGRRIVPSFFFHRGEILRNIKERYREAAARILSLQCPINLALRASPSPPFTLLLLFFLSDSKISKASCCDARRRLGRASFAESSERRERERSLPILCASASFHYPCRPILYRSPLVKKPFIILAKWLRFQPCR